LNNIFKNIEHSAIGEKSQDNFKDLFNNINVNNKELGSSVININKKLKKIIIAIAEVNLDDYKNNSKDSFGNAYEYLMTMYASNAGKKGGEFFTPQEVSELLTRITLIDKDGKYKKEINKVYDPAAGSGSLLLNFAKIIGKENIRLGFFGQEIDIETYNLCRINMFLHNIGYDKFDIQLGDTLIEPKHLDEDKFEAIVSNPKYSVK
jgi:type I restriction enzyme M protein